MRCPNLQPEPCAGDGVRGAFLTRFDRSSPYTVHGTGIRCRLEGAGHGASASRSDVVITGDMKHLTGFLVLFLFTFLPLSAADLSDLTYTATSGEAKLVADVSDFPLARFTCPLKPDLRLAEKSICGQ